jgi:hypothetical protein
MTEEQMWCGIGEKASHTAALASATTIVLMSQATSMCVREDDDAGDSLNTQTPDLIFHNLRACCN